MLAHNRPRLTLQALRSLGDFDGNTSVLFDNPDNEEMNVTLNTWSCDDSHPFRKVYRVEESRGTGWARNEVIRLSEKEFGRGDYLYLSDNDVYFYPAIFEKLVPIFEYASTLGFSVLAGYGHPYHLPLNSIPVYGGGREVISHIKEVQAIALQSMLMRWETWDKYGPFKETPPGRVCMGEDVDFGNAITKDGGKLGVVDPALLVNTGITNSFGEKIPGWEMVMKETPVGVYVE